MTGWIVLGAILLLLLLLLLAPLSVRIFADKDRLSVRARYLFVSIDFSPEALARRSEKKAEKEVKKEVKTKEKVESKPKAEKDTGKMVWTLVKSSRKGLGILRRHLIFSGIRLYLSVGAPDAHQAAIRYSQFCMLAAGLLDVIGVLFVLRKPKVVIQPDFLRDGLRYEVSARISIRPLFLLAAGASVFYRFFRAELAAKNRPKKPVQTQKAS